MKIRTGFVSNSSSSSFICLVCGNVESGYDMSMRDAEFVLCENGHEFCLSHLSNEVLTLLQKPTLDKDGDEIEDCDDWEENIPAEHCPICTLKKITDTDLLGYILKTSNKSRNDVEDEIRSEFKNVQDLDLFLK